MNFSLVFFIGTICLIAAEEVTPPPPMHGNFGGTKLERANLVQKLLSTVTPEQTQAITDRNSLLTEGIKAFNITFSVQAQAYSIVKSALTSNKPKCDSMSNGRADEIIKKARDDTISCFATFRNQILIDGKGLNDIRDLPSDKIKAVVIPLDDCFQELKVKTVELLGHVSLDHAICRHK